MPIVSSFIYKEPRESDARSRHRICSKLMRLDESCRQRGPSRRTGNGLELFRMQVCLQIGKHVSRSRADCSGSREGIQIPGVCGVMMFVMTCDEADLLRGGEGYGCVFQPQRINYLFL